MDWQPTTLLLIFIGFGLAVYCLFFRNPNSVLSMTRFKGNRKNPDAILKLVVEHVHDGLLVQDIYGRIECPILPSVELQVIRGGDRWARPQEFILADENQLTDEEIDTFQYDLDVFKTGFVERILNRRKNGELFWNELTFAILEGSRSKDTKIILISRDITQQVEHLEELEEVRKRLKYRAEHDDLTNVANRAKLNTFLKERLERADTNSNQIGILHLDLDLFKDINDAFGHSAGDAVLVHVAKVLTSTVGDKGFGSASRRR